MEIESSDNLSDLRSQIQQALGQAIEFVIRFAGDHGLEGAFPSYTFQLQYMKPVDPAHSRLVTEDRTETSLTHFYIDHRKQLDSAKPIVDLNSLCDDFKNRYGVEMAKYFRQDYGTMMVHRYFEKVGKFSHEEPVAAEVVGEFENDLTASREQLESVYYVEGLHADAPFTLWDGKVTFAPISDEDLLNYARRDFILYPQALYLDSGAWICHIFTDGDKSTYDDFNNAAEYLDLLLNAISLISEGNVRCRLLSKEVTNTFLHVGRLSGGESTNSGRGESVHLSVSDVAKLDEMLHNLSKVATDKNLKLLRHPLRRMRTAANRRSAADAFIDTVIALEGLLAHDTPALETTHRFRLRGAALLSSEFGSPQQRLQLLNTIYAMRSRIVHGDDADVKLDILLRDATRILKSIVTRYIELSDRVKPEDVIRVIDEQMVEQACIAPGVEHRIDD